MSMSLALKRHQPLPATNAKSLDICMIPVRVVALGLLAFFVPVICAEPGHQIVGNNESRPAIRRSTPLMSTIVDFTIYSDQSTRANVAIDQAIIEIERIVSVMSEWRPNSAVSQINQFAGQKPVTTTPELLHLLKQAKRLGTLTHGKFDITFASAGKLWDFRAGIIPIPQDIATAVKRIDFQKLHLDEQAMTAYLERAGMKIGLGGIAKGYAIDQAVEILRRQGFSDFIVNAGGDLYVGAKSNQQPWQIGIQSPRDRKIIIAILPASNVAIATSGDYERFFIRDGKRYSHIIDPDTGYPANQCQSVTILTPSTYRADALATGVFVLGPHQGMALVEQLENVEALIVDRDGNISLSSGLEQP